MKYILELENGQWRLIVVEVDDEGIRSVNRIVESDSLADLNDWIDDLSKIERISASIDYLVEPYRSIKRRLTAEAQITYIRDCFQAYIDAVQELKDRKAELEQAIKEDYDV